MLPQCAALWLPQVLKGADASLSGKDNLLALQSELVAAEYQLAQTQAALADACRRQADTERQQVRGWQNWLGRHAKLPIRHWQCWQV